MGMFLGETIMKVLRPEISLSFDLNKSDKDVLFLNSLADVRDMDMESTKTEIIKVPAEQVESSKKVIRGGNTSFGVVETVEISDSDFKPLLTPGSEHMPTQRKTLYLRDCIKNLGSENPDLIEIALHALPSIIAKSDRHDLEDVFETLSQRLLAAQNTFDVDDFELYIQECILAIGIRLPKLIAKKLNEWLTGDDRALMARIAALRYIAIIVSTGMNRTSSSSAVSTAKGKLAEEKTQFINTLPEFFFPLIDSFIFLNSLYESHQTAHHLLIDSFLKTATIILKSSENSIACINMARELLSTVLKITYDDQDTSSRQSLLTSVNIVFAIVPTVLVEDEFGVDALTASVLYLENAACVENDEATRVRVMELANRLQRICA
ncbi:TEL2, telomere maintenance protein 2 [Entophlyctis luteolus]|nr:TEL2, telomere maintenance protein 2 [Entophlyctis luteolus]